MPARAIMLQGTGFECRQVAAGRGARRALTARGLTVRPFKPQNMSNNAAVTVEGGEIGRAQALQARAARVAPSVHMNPVLLKPQSEIGAQIVVQGKVYGTAGAREYQAVKPKLLPQVLESFATLKAEADIVLVEGAGSASEINLRAQRHRQYGLCPRGRRAGGGDRRHRPRRGDRQPGRHQGGARARGREAGRRLHRQPACAATHLCSPRAWRRSRERTGWPALGLVPILPKPRDAAGRGCLWRSASGSSRAGGGRIKIAVPMLPRIANFDDLDPLAAEPEVDLILVKRGNPLPAMRSRHPARLEGDDRRPRRASRARAGTSTSPRMSAVAAACSGFAGDIRCSERPSPIRKDRRTGRHRSRARPARRGDGDHRRQDAHRDHRRDARRRRSVQRI